MLLDKDETFPFSTNLSDDMTAFREETKYLLFNTQDKTAEIPTNE